MSGEISNNPEQSGQQVQIDDSKVTASYVNYCRITGTPEEIILDFGLNSQPLGSPQQSINVSNRIVTSFYSAKRMLLTLQSAIQRHENAFGEIEIDVQKRVITHSQPHYNISK
jgi:fructosamine-3-kinase